MQTLFVLHEDMVFLQLCKFSKQSASLEETGARRQWRRIPGTHMHIRSKVKKPGQNDAGYQCSKHGCSRRQNTRGIFDCYDGHHVIEEDETHENNENAVHVTPTQLLSIGKYFNEICV